MAMTPEAKVKNAVKKWLDSHGFWRAGAIRPIGDIIGWYYLPVSNGMGVHGIPDFCCVYAGHAVYLEAKAPGGTTTPNQDQRHHEIRVAGGLVCVVTDVAQLEDLFK
jgi:hypothetical protein